MSIEFPCSACGTILRVPDDTAGKKAACPKCQAISVIPVPLESSSADSVIPQLSPYSPSYPSKPQSDNAFDSAGSTVSSWAEDDFVESDNPFQTPHDFRDTDIAEPINEEVTPVKLRFRKTVAETFRNFTGKIFSYLLLGVLTGVIVGGWYGFMIIIGTSIHDFRTAALFLICTFLVCLMLIFGFLGSLLGIAKHGRFSIEYFAKGLKKSISCTCYMVILCLMFLGLMIAVNVVTGVFFVLFRNSTVFESILTTIIYILVFWMCFRFAWGPLLIIDQNISSFRALRWSPKISRGSTFKGVLVVLLHYLPSMILSMLMFAAAGDRVFQESVMLGVWVILIAILMFLISVYHLCLYAVMYLLMSGQYTCTQHSSAVTDTLEE
ncbi:MAG: hypothetical protein LBQ54_16615 [Planctomycetaceae bacterium]|nr:hypothetical protein [Planctomycetaceae bacterium]